MRKTSVVAPLMLAVVFATCERSNRAAPEAPDPLFLNAASQDRALYLTWNRAPDSQRVTLHCRRTGSDTWRAVEGDSRGYHLIDGLENDAAYECYAERIGKTGEKITSRPVTQTPRDRAFTVGAYLTSQQAVEDWLKLKRLDLTSLRVRGQAVNPSDPILPDGAYIDPSGRVEFILLRHADEVFHPPASPRSPGDVRTVLKHALWHRFNPFDHPHQFPMPITPMKRPIVGAVRQFASATSFVVAYHPQLSSRCTRFIPPNPAPGKVAIYMNGHLGTVRFGATTIEQLLDRGWQVIAVDMPLAGENVVDRTPTLRTHNSFHAWDSADSSPVSLFLQPLKAIVDKIEAEPGSHTIMLIGKSGGGWTSFMYGALDERVDYVVGIACGMPMSQWLRRGVPYDPPPRHPGWRAALGKGPRAADYEQMDPLIYESVGYEDIMPVAGSRGTFYVYNQNDPCCFRLQPDDAFIRYLKDASAALDKPIGVYVDSETADHELTKPAFAEAIKFVEVTQTAAQLAATGGGGD